VPTDTETANFVASLPEAFLECRDYGHTWRPLTARWDGEMHAYERTMGCARCDTTRSQWLSAYGHALRGSYSYPEGYQHLGQGRLDGAARDALRLESVSRMLNVTPITMKRRARRAA